MVTVEARTWANGGILYNPGDIVVFTSASGTWYLGIGTDPTITVSPDGNDLPNVPKLCPTARLGSLCGYFGTTTPQPPSGYIDAPVPTSFFIGSGPSIVFADKTGYLWLGQNDTYWDDNHGSITSNFSSNITGCVYGTVYHIIDQLGSTTIYPLNNVKVEITAYLKINNNILYSYTYVPIYTNMGIYAEYIDVNPFSIWTAAGAIWALRKLVYGEGWNRVSIKFSTCSTSATLDAPWSSISVYMPNAYLNHTLFEYLYVRDDINNTPIEIANVNMYQSHLSSPAILTNYEGVVQFTVHPMYTTHLIQKNGYGTYTPIYNLYTGHDCQNCTVTKTALITALLPTGGAVISFVNKDSIGYYPSSKLQLNYNVGMVNGVYRTGAYIKIFKPDNSLLIKYPLVGGLEPFFYNTLPIKISPGTNNIRGMYLAVLYDNTNIELANDSVFFGTKGTLSYNTSAYCAENKITISWAGVDPTYMFGTSPFPEMILKVYGSADELHYTFYIDTVSGNKVLDITGKVITNQWRATLTDQWGIVINTKYITIMGCDQKLYGSVKTLIGQPIEGATIFFDLTDMGFGTYDTVSDNIGNYMIAGFQPFSTHDVTCYIVGYSSQVVNLSISEGEWKEQNFTLGGLLTGTVIDVEDNPIHRAAVWIFGKCYGTTNDQGIYNISLMETGTYNLNVIKNNFIINTKSINLSDLINTVTTNFTLTRKTQETYSANFPTTTLVCETSGIQCDDLTTSTITTSGQQIVLADYTNSKKGSSARSVQTGRGLYEIENYSGLNDYSTRIISVGNTLTLKAGFVIKVEDINLYVTRIAILELLHDGDSIEMQIIFPNTTVVFEGEVDGESYYIRLGIGEMFFSKELGGVVFIESIYQGTALTGPGCVNNIAQRFETDFNFNHFKVALINDAFVYENGEFVQTYNAPCRVNVMLYDETGYTVTGTSIAFGTPIFKDTVVLLPGTAQYVDFYCITQPPGYYCIQMKIPDDEIKTFKIGGMTPNLYYDSVGNLMKVYEDGIEIAPSISLMMVIYEAPMQIERYLIRAGATDVTNIYTVDSKDTNLVLIE